MMKSCYLIAAALLCLALFEMSNASPPDPKPKKVDQPASRVAPQKLKVEQEELKARDLKKLQGKWVVVRNVFGSTPQKLKGTENWVFKDDTIKDYNNIKGTFTIDTATRPKRLTYTYTDEEGKQRTVAAIYTFDDDHLLLSKHSFYQSDEDTYPSDFSGSGDHFLRLKRAGD